ncbi:hypothetical protein COH20_007705 [Aspergillus terreus]|uniref:Uncharacterized protein n=1 Tax=Aspergillus terreus TaxID=33178 RepID=A0A5M3YN56_ASPTE|nr:hypothetical protein ATETN484_0002000200 [Aspergillus terreus]GFF13651.1 hypothetical protein COH20_007705 [Aspergillus terreus]
MPPKMRQKVTDQVTSRTVVRERLPNLLIGASRTSGSALHPIQYVGTLEPWANFEQAVMNAFESHAWDSRKKILSYKPHGFLPLQSLRNEHVVQGEEMGVQGRWQAHIGQEMSAVFLDQRINLTIGDFRAANSTYSELKVPWIQEHSLSNAMADEESFRHVLGQIAQYMKDFHLKYGIMSTYEQTIFLQQVPDLVTGGWKLQYSPVIRHWLSGTQRTVSVRQCIWYIGVQANAQHSAPNNLPNAQWVQMMRRSG